VFKWAISSVCDANGEPSQVIGLAAATKVAFLRTTKPQEHRLLEEIQSSISKMNWTKLISGISRDHPKADNESLWNDGITTILRSTLYLALFLPRTKFATTSDENSFSRYFRKEHAVFFSCMAMLNQTGMSVDFVTGVFKAASSVVTTNEDEARDMNVTRAEIFAGFCRAFYDPDSSCLSSLSASEKQAIENSLSAYLAGEQTNRNLSSHFPS
jgi:hypothetical protein